MAITIDAKKRLRVAVCTSAHPHDDARIFHREAVTLAEQFDVTVIACAPFERKAIHEHLRVEGLPPWKRKTDRLRNLWRLWRKIRSLPAEVYIFHDTIGILLIPLVRIRRLGRTVYDIHENFYGWIREKDWIPAPLRPLAAYSYLAAERFILRFTDMIWFAVPDIAEHYRNYTRLPKLLVGNLPSLKQYRLPEGDAGAPGDQFVFVGTMDADRSILQIIRAFDRFYERNRSYRLILAGGFYDHSYEAEVRELLARLPSGPAIKLLGRVPYETLPELIARSRAGLSLHQPTYNFLRSMPLKLLEYIGMGVPVIASDFPNFRSIVDAGPCGICVDPNDEAAIAGAMQALADDAARSRELGRNGRQLIEAEYNWEKAGAAIISAITQLCRDDRRR